MSEHVHQCAVISWWAIAHKAFHLPENALYATPNGGHRSKAVAGKLKAEGTRQGVFDLNLPVARGAFKGLWLEMKYGKNKLTPEQTAFKAWQESEGAKCVVCYDWTDARAEIEDYLAQPKK